MARCEPRARAAPPRISTRVASVAPPFLKDAMAYCRMSKGSSLVDDRFGTFSSIVFSIRFMRLVLLKPSCDLWKPTDELVEGHWIVPETDASCVMDRVGNRGRDSTQS